MSHFELFLIHLRLKRSIFAVFNKASFKFAHSEGTMRENDSFLLRINLDWLSMVDFGMY